MSQKRLSKYKIMWIFCFFDLPTHTAIERKNASLFRKILLKDGFKMMQFSVYIRHSSSLENAQVHINRIKKSIPSKGYVSILTITDKQYGNIINHTNFIQSRPPPTPVQLTLF